MATSSFKSTTKRPPIGDSSSLLSSPSTEDSMTSSSSKPHRRSRSLSRFSRRIPAELEQVTVPTPRRKFVNTVRGSDFPEISLDDLAIEFFSGKDNGSEMEDESVSSESRSSPALFQQRSRSRSVSRNPSGGSLAVCSSGSAAGSAQRRGRSVSRRNGGDGAGSSAGGAVRVVTNGDSRRRRSVSVARHQLSDTESDIDLSRSSASQPKSRSMNNGNSRVASFQRPTASSHRRLTRSMSQAPQRMSHGDYSGDLDLSRRSATQPKSRSMNNGNSRVASFQRPTASSHRRLTRSMSQAPQMRSHDDYMSQSSAQTDDDLRVTRYGRNEIEKTIRAVYAQKKIDHPTGDDANIGLCEAMRKELRSAVNEIMIELEQTMERKPWLSVHDRLYSNTTRKNNTTKLKQLEKHKQALLAERALEEQRVQDGFKIVREVLPESKSNSNAQKVSFSRKRSNDRNRVSRRLNEEAEKYFEDFISNVEDTDFSSFDEERSDTSSSLVGSTTKQKDGALPTDNGNIISLPVEMEGVNLPWLKWGDNDSVPPTTPKTKLWDPSQDLKMIQERGNRSNSSHGSWNPEHTTASLTNAKGNRTKEAKSPQFNMVKYIELKRTEEQLFDSWRERSVIRSGGLFLCSVGPF